MQHLTRLNSCIHYFQFFRNLRMQTQAFIIQFFIFAIVFLIIVASHMVNRSLMDDIVQKISKEMEIQTNVQQINIYSSYITYQANYPLEQGFRLLESFNKVNQMRLKGQKSLDSQLIQCSSEQIEFQYYTKLPLFCCTLVNNDRMTEQSLEYQLWNHINGYNSLLNSIFLPISLSQFQKTMFYTFISSEKYFAILPPKVVPKSYLPSERPWYQEQIEEVVKTNSNNTIVISSVYQDYETSKYIFTLTRGLTDINNNLQGIFGIDQTLEHYKALLKYQSLNIVVVNLAGRMLLSNLIIQQNIDLSVESIFIFESDITGFDESDWNEMIVEARKTNSGQTECTMKVHQFCRYNSLFQEDLIIIVINISNQFYLIVFQSISQIKLNIEDAQQLQDQVMYQITFFLYWCIIVAVFLLLLSWVITPIFFKPLRNIQKIIKVQMVSKFTIHYDHILFSSRKKTNLAFFQNSFNVFKQKLLDFAQSKSRDCYLIENFKYPQQQSQVNSQLSSFIKQQIQISQINNIPSKSKIVICSPILVSDPLAELESQYSCKNSQIILNSMRDITFRIQNLEI